MNAFAQLPTSHEFPIALTDEAWQVGQSAASSKSRLDLVTIDQPHRRQSCRVKSFTADKLVCSRAAGGARTYLPQQIIALILPGDRGYKLRALFALNGSLGGAIWGTVVLAATCPGCAAATAVVALVLFCAAGAIAMGDEQPDHLLYLAPGQQLTGKLLFIHP
jgi:hypothetical protein